MGSTVDSMEMDTAQRRAKIVEMYQRGAKTAEICQEAGVSRSTLYFILHEEGVKTSRLRQQRSSTSASVPPATESDLLNWALKRVAELENENGVLREQQRLAREALRG